MEPVQYLFLVLGGFAAGILNVVAGGGSFITLPILIFLGLPPTLANATNRVGIFFQNIGAVWGFNRYAVLDWSSFKWAALPATLGTFLGVWMAVNVSDDFFRKTLALVMVGLTVLILHRPVEGRNPDLPLDGARLALTAVAFTGVGVFSGFIQAGVGFLILAATSALGFDLVRGNAIKVLCILISTALSLILFSIQGMVEWLPGLALALGTTAGGLIGVRLTVLKGQRWLRAVITITVIAFAIRLWFWG